MPRKRFDDEPTKPAPPVEEQADAMFTVAELAKRWRTSHHTIGAAIRDGRLQAFKPNKRGWRVRASEVARYEQQMTAVAS